MTNLAIEKLEKERDEVIAFLESKIHQRYLATTRKDIAFVEERILQDPVDTQATLYQIIEWKAKRTLLLSNLTLFEDAVSTLNDNIEAILVAEKPSETQEETQ